MSAIAAARGNDTATWTPMTREQREQFDADGYLVLKGVLSPDEVRHYASVLETAHQRHPRAADGSLHTLGRTTSPTSRASACSSGTRTAGSPSATSPACRNGPGGPG